MMKVRNKTTAVKEEAVPTEAVLVVVVAEEVSVEAEVTAVVEEKAQKILTTNGTWLQKNMFDEQYI